MTPAELYRAAFGADPAYAAMHTASGPEGEAGPWRDGWRIWNGPAEVCAPTAAQALRAWRALHGQDDPILAVMEAGSGELMTGGRKVIEWQTPAGRMRVTLEVEGPESVEATAEDVEWARREMGLGCDDGKGATFALIHYQPDPRTEEQWLLGAVVESAGGEFTALTVDDEPCERCLGRRGAVAYRMCRDRMRAGVWRNLSPYVISGETRRIPEGVEDPVAWVKSMLSRVVCDDGKGERT